MKTSLSTAVTPSLVLAAVVFLELGGCSKEAPVEPTNEARIVPGVGVDGVRLGDYPEVAVTKIGQPTAKGEGDAPKGGYTTYHYTEGPHRGIYLWFLEGFIGDSINVGPLDMLFVDTLYTGTTKEGIGIGASPSDVIAVWGSPATSDSTRFPYFTYGYRFPEGGITLGFRNNRLTYMSMGGFVQ